MNIEEIKVYQYIKNQLRNPEICETVIKHILEDSILKHILKDLQNQEVLK